jgi:hypothetical protein
MSTPLDTSHSLTVLSTDPEARDLPSEEKLTEYRVFVCPMRVRTSTPLDASHSLMLSTDPEARNLPSGEKATE